MAMDLDTSAQAGDQDKLALLFGGALGGNAQDVVARLTKGAVGGADPSGVAPIPGMPSMRTATPTPPATPPPAASDDPSITGRPAMAQVPTFQNPPVDKMQDLSSRIAQASAPVRRQDNQPHWWERMLSVPIAAANAYAADNAGAGIKAGNAILNRRYNLAMENQAKTVNPLEEEFKRQQGIEPFLHQANENSQNTFMDQDRLYDQYQRSQDRQDATSQRRDAASERDEARQAQQRTKDDEDRFTPSPAARPELYLDNGKPAMRVRTKSGDYIPYTPKSIDEGALLNYPGARDLYRTAHPGREAGGGKKASEAQFRMIETKMQNDLADAEDEYNKTISDLDDTASIYKRGGKAGPDDSAQRKAALDKLNSKKQRYENAYESEIAAAGGSPQHFDYSAGGRTGVPTPTPTTRKGPGATVTDTTATSKSVSKDVVQKYADSHKMSYEKALSGFKSKGYNVQ